MSEIEERLARIEALLASRPAAVNPLEAIGKLMESELVQGVQEKAEIFESDMRLALKAIWASLSRVETQLNRLEATPRK